jgi:hypothetical protein
MKFKANYKNKESSPRKYLDQAKEYDCVSLNIPTNFNKENTQ